MSEDEHKERAGSPDLYVVKVLNARELVIAGSGLERVSEGMTLRVIGEPVPLQDPVTGEHLGTLTGTKVLLRVYDIASKYALARTFRSKSVLIRGTPALRGLGDLFSPPEYETRTETLQRDSSKDLSGESAVQTGDHVEIYEGPVDEVPGVTVWE